MSGNSHTSMADPIMMPSQTHSRAGFHSRSFKPIRRFGGSAQASVVLSPKSSCRSDVSLHYVTVTRTRSRVRLSFVKPDLYFGDMVDSIIGE